MANNTRHLLRVGILANAFEWYEFSSYGFLVGIFSELFFKSTSSTVALIKAFILFSLSHIIRPLGSLFFGWIGGYIGRNQILKISLLLMAIPSTLIGFLPTYAQIGSLATFALLGLRLIQGFAAGGELGANACYVFEESVSTKMHSLLCSAVSVGPLIGVLLGSAVAGLSMSVSPEMQAWSWRIPFWLSIPLTYFIFKVRREIFQTEPVHQGAHKKRADLPFQILKAPPLFQGIAIIAFMACVSYTLIFFMPIYLTHFLQISSLFARWTNTLTLVSIIPFCLVAGKLSQRYGYIHLIFYSSAAIIILVYPLFLGLQTAQSWLSLLAFQLILACFLSGINGTYVELLGNLFLPKDRLLGISLSATIASTLVGSTTPMLYTAILHKTGWLSFPAFYIMAFGLVALLVAWRLKSTAKA